MELVIMEEFEDLEDVVAGEFDKDDEFAYREDGEGWKSADGIDILNKIYQDGDISAIELLDLHNEYCEVNESVDDMIEFMDEFESLLGDSFSEIYPRLGEFDINDDFFWFDEGGKINSGDIDDAIDAEVDWDAIAKAILAGELSKDIYEIAENI